jgi:hypothetical protein
MLALLWFAITNLLVPLIVWSTIFVLAALVAGAPVARWCVVKMRRRPTERALSQTRRWLLLSWIVVVLFVVPVSMALVQAIPFAASRGLAQLIENAEPDTTQWIADFVAAHGPALGLDPEQVRSWTTTGSSALVNDFTASLHLAAWGHLASAVALLAACHVATIALFRVAVRRDGSAADAGTGPPQAISSGSSSTQNITSAP